MARSVGTTSPLSNGAIALFFRLLTFLPEYRDTRRIKGPLSRGD